MGIIKTLLIFAVVVFDFTLVTRSIRPDQLAANDKPYGSKFESRGDVAFAVGKAVDEFKAFVRLNPLNE